MHISIKTTFVPGGDGNRHDKKPADRCYSFQISVFIQKG